MHRLTMERLTLEVRYRLSLLIQTMRVTMLYRQRRLLWERQTWASGTTLAIDSAGSPHLGLCEVRYHSRLLISDVSIRIWSPIAGITVMVKIEDQTNGTRFFVEAQDVIARSECVGYAIL